MNTKLIKNASIAGVQFNETDTIVSDAALAQEVSVPPGKIGSVTSRTTAQTAGVLAGPTSHGIVTAQIVDLYWSGGARRGVTVGTVSGLSIPVSGGTGSLLPAASTAITIAARTEVAFQVNGDKVELIAVGSDSPDGASFAFKETGNSEFLSKAFPTGGPNVYAWDIYSADANPLAGENVKSVLLSHGSTSAKKMRVGASFDN